MDWNFRNDQPIYSQLTQRLTEAIVSGIYAPGEKLPSVRELAVEAGVNPNTVQRALASSKVALATRVSSWMSRRRSKRSATWLM